MNSISQMFFNASKSEGLTYNDILEDVQQYCTNQHADKLAGEGDQEKAKALLQDLILQYVLNCNYSIEDISTEELCDMLYEDMAGCSFLKKWIYKENVEEVNSATRS